MSEAILDKKPLVSVITPVYNHEKYIAQTIQSILDQTYQNWEMLIVDDCSKDGSWDIIQEWAKKDSRIKAFRNEENKGLIPNWKFLIDNSKGEYISFLEGDDLFSPENLQSKIEVFEKYSRLGMVYCNFEVIDDNKLVTTKDFYKKLKVKTYKCQKIKPEEYLRSKYILFSTYSQIMINREVLLVSGYPRSFDLSTKVFLPSDWDFNFMVSTRNEIYYINEILLQYRKHSSNNSANTLKVSEQLRMILNSYEKEYAGNEKVQQAIKYMRGKTCYFNIVYYIENGMKRKAFGNLLTYIGKYPVNIFCDFPWSFLLFFRILLPNRIDAYLKKLYLSS